LNREDAKGAKSDSRLRVDSDGANALAFAFLMTGQFLSIALLAAVTISRSAVAADDLVQNDASRTTPVKSTWNVRDHIPLEKVIVQSHRGAGVLAEEGTIESFELGWKLGTYPESDLRATKDGVIVSFHDENFARVVKDASPELKKKGVKDLTFAELSQLDVGSWKGEQFKGRRVLPMATVFESMRTHPERHIYMDVKKIECPALAQEVKKYGIEKQIVLASPKVEQLRQWKALVPESETLLWMHGNEEKLSKELAELRAKKFAGVTQVQIHVYPKETKDTWAPPTDESSPENPFRLRNAFLLETGEDLRKHGVLFQTFPYTTDATAYAKLLDLGVMSFATDHPDVAMREIKAYYEAAGARRK
jgi:glycerophosphoryl diester phosphodiesterase